MIVNCYLRRFIKGVSLAITIVVGLVLVFINILSNTNLVFAAGEGHMGIYTDTNGTFETNVASWTGVPFNNQKNQDTTFTQNANDIDVDLAEAGRYLYGYTVAANDASYNLRMSWLTRTTLGGTQTDMGHGQGYRRNTGNNIYYSYGYGLVDATAGQDLRVEIIRDSTTANTHTTIANRSAFWILRMDDTWDYLRLQAQDNQSTTVATQNVNFTTLRENTNTGVFSHSTTVTPEQIQLLETGHYLVVYSLGVDSSTDRTTITSNLTLNNADVGGSFDYSYMRFDDGTDEGSNSNISIIDATANDILRLEWGATGAYSAYGTQTVAGRTAIAVVRLPDTAEYLRTHHAGTGQTINGTTTTAVIFDTQDEADSGSFSYNTSSGLVTIQDTADYLFTVGGRTNRGTSGATRLTRAGAFHVGGTRQDVGNTYMFVRGDQSTQDTFDGGWSAAGLFSLLNTDTVDFRYIDEGDDGNSGDTLQPGQYGMSAVNLVTLFPPPTYSLNDYRWYVDNDTENVTDPWGREDIAENTAITLMPASNDAPNSGQELRLRVNFTVATSNLDSSEQQFKLQFKAGTDESCTTGSWTDVGAAQAWEYAPSSVTDGTNLTVAKLTASDVLEEYAKSSPTQINHNSATLAQDIEYDFHIVGTNSVAKTKYSFRVVESDGTIFDSYTTCPTLTTEPGVSDFMRHGRFYDSGVKQGFYWAN